jgi:hypothetical protein
MKQLSFWALMNPYKAQFIITISQLFLTAIAIYSGIWLFSQDIILPNLVFYTGLTLFFIAFACYPIRRARYAFWKNTFTKQKTMDAILLGSYLLTAVTVSNRDANIAWKATDSQSRKMQIVLKNEVKEAPQQLTFKEKLIKKYVKFVVTQKITQTRPNAGATIAIFLLAVVLMFGVAILACGLSCSGSNTAGLVLLIGGWALILLGSISALRELRLKRKNNYQPMPDTPTPE